MVPETQPDQETCLEHLRHITRRWDELHEEARLELRFLTADDQAQVRDVRRYPATEQGIRDAADHAAAMNVHKLNAYCVVNPIRASAEIPTTKAASDAHILASFYHWADADDAQAAQNIRSFVGPRPTFYVLTGTQPCERPHVYWELEEPTLNLKAWTETQRAIAATLKTDAAVINPSRIMRLAGTVNWPKPKKLAKGYVAELTRLNVYDPERRPAATSEQMRRAFVPTAAPTSGLQIDIGPAPRSATEYADMLTRARTDGQKHTGVRDLSAALAGSGVSRHMAEAIIREACPVWDANVEGLIDSAYAKFYKADERPAAHFDHPPTPDGPGWKIQTAASFTQDFVAPEYVVDGIVQRGRLYTLTAPTGSGKTAAMLYLAMVIGTVGQQFCGKDVEHGDVLFLAGENPDDVRARVIGTLDFYGIDANKCRLHFIPGTFNIATDLDRLAYEAAKLPNLMMTVVDTFAAYFDGDDENSNAQALRFARVVRNITEFPSKPAVIMPAHPVKNAMRGNLSPKGGSSLLNEVDGNLTLWKDDALISMHWQGKFRGPEFEPLTMELKRHECDSIKDSKGRLMPTVLAQPVLTMRATQLARERMTLEDRTLLAIHDEPASTKAERAAMLQVTPTRYQRIIEKLAQQKLIRKFRNKWELTKDGDRAVEEITAGEQQPAEIE